MFCSIIIPTVGRETAERAIFSVLDQKFPQNEFEVIVVNDSGKALPNADWQQAGCVRVVHTHHNERSVARNTGAAIA
jgi:glycosyltransferase involved in cell wall biosynthesis